MRFKDESNYPQAIQFFNEERSHLPPADPTTRPTTTEARWGDGRIQQSPSSSITNFNHFHYEDGISFQDSIQISKFSSSEQSQNKNKMCVKMSMRGSAKLQPSLARDSKFSSYHSSRRRPRRGPLWGDVQEEGQGEEWSDAGRHPPRHCQLPTCCDQTISMLSHI